MIRKLKRGVRSAAKGLSRSYRRRRARYRYEDFGYRRFISAPGFESVPSWNRPFDVPAMMREHGVETRGVIQAGAHKGNEVQLFLEHGFERILLIEANPDMVDGLRTRFAHEPRVHVFHAAVSDTEGVCRFNIATGDAQSSSILDPTLHKRIYKGIRFQQTIEVRAATLDTIVREAGFCPADFNMIVLDIQGAEIMALSGAIEQLRHTDAVLSEFSNIELYKDSGTLDDLRALLRCHGLNLAAVEVNWHPTWGDCLFVRKPVVQMQDLGSNGRFGNQLFQSAFLHIASRSAGAVVQTPLWVGHELYQFPYAPCAPKEQQHSLAMVHEELVDVDCVNQESLDQINALLEDHPVVDVRGFFTDITFLAPYREQLRTLFTLAQPWRDLVDAAIDQLRSQPGPLVGVHLRRGDYGYKHFYRAPHPWYTAWVDELLGAEQAGVVYICSEDPEPYKPLFAPHPALSAVDFTNVPKAVRWLLDFEVLRHADHVAISNSTYSYMAAFLNRTEGVIARPCVKRECMVPFDPCRGPVHDSQPLGTHEHERLARLDRI